jgi:PST family polysaccharide transporter
LDPLQAKQAMVESKDISLSSEQPPAGSSHTQALKATTIIGGSTFIALLIRMVRTKVLALLLGPAGVGLERMYYSIIDLARTIGGLGVNSSGVRQIAEAVGSGDEQVIARTVTTLRRISIIIGALGAIAFFALREPISRLTFGHAEHSGDVGLLSIILFLGAVNGGQGALLQGMRRIGDMAKMGIIGAIIATVVSIPIVYIWGLKGIPAYMIIGAAMSELVAWLYARRIRVKTITVSLAQIISEAFALLKMGLILMSSGLMSLGALYFIGVLVTRQEGVAGAGQFWAANSLSMVYISFILQAMGTDFYPRLTAVATDHAKCSQMVNEQAEVSLLLALPGILGTLAFAPWVIRVFYSAKFGIATEILCWQMTGMLLRVGCWPLGMVPVAIGRAKISLWTETAAAAVYLLFAWIGLKYFGLPGTGMAFVGSYIVYGILIYAVVRNIAGFRWSPSNVRLALWGTLAVAIAFIAHLLLSALWALAIGAILTLLLGTYCFKALWSLVGVERINRNLHKLGIRFSFSSRPGPGMQRDSDGTGNE